MGDGRECGGRASRRGQHRSTSGSTPRCHLPPTRNASFSLQYTLAFGSLPSSNLQHRRSNPRPSLTTCPSWPPIHAKSCASPSPPRGSHSSAGCSHSSSRAQLSSGCDEQLRIGLSTQRHSNRVRHFPPLLARRRSPSRSHSAFSSDYGLRSCSDLTPDATERSDIKYNTCALTIVSTWSSPTLTTR